MKLTVILSFRAIHLIIMVQLFGQLLKASTRFDALDIDDTVEGLEAFEDIQPRTNDGATSKTPPPRHPSTAVTSSQVEKPESRISANMPPSTEQIEEQLCQQEQWQRQWHEFEVHDGQKRKSNDYDAHSDVSDDIDEKITSQAAAKAHMTLSRLSKPCKAANADSRPRTTSSGERDDVPPTPPTPGFDEPPLSDPPSREQDLNEDSNLSLLPLDHDHRRFQLRRRRHHHCRTTSPTGREDPFVSIAAPLSTPHKGHGDFASWKRELDTIRLEKKVQIQHNSLKYGDIEFEGSDLIPKPPSAVAHTRRIQFPQNQLQTHQHHSLLWQIDSNESSRRGSVEKTVDDVNPEEDESSVLATISIGDEDSIEKWRRTSAMPTPTPDDRSIQLMLRENVNIVSSRQNCNAKIFGKEGAVTDLPKSRTTGNDLFPMPLDRETTKGGTKHKVANSIQHKSDLAPIRKELGNVKVWIKEPLSPKPGRTAKSDQKEQRRKKSVKFSSDLILSTHYRPKTQPEEIENLYWDEDELYRWEEDRVTTSPDRIEVTLSITSGSTRPTSRNVSSALVGKETIGVDSQMGHTILHFKAPHDNDDDTISILSPYETVGECYESIASV